MALRAAEAMRIDGGRLHAGLEGPEPLLQHWAYRGNGIEKEAVYVCRDASVFQSRVGSSVSWMSNSLFVACLCVSATSLMAS